MADDDSFIREVDEQIREDRAKELWSKYGKYVIGLAVLIVAATAALRGWEYYNDSRAAADGDAFMTAVDLSNDGEHDQALVELEKIAASGTGRYPALARLRSAAELAAKGDAKAAIAAYDAIATDSAIDGMFQDIARLRAGLLAVDLEDYPAIKTRLESLAAAGAPFRHSAREALGIAALNAGQNQEALGWFQSIIDDAGVVSGVGARAQIMLDLLAGKGVSAGG